MATCEIDVEPQSLFGVTCGLRLREGKCPEHGETTEPNVHDHAEPTHQRVAEVLANLTENLAG